MMISPEAYYEFHLKGKDEERILRAIRGLKWEMGHLKNVMEHPDYDKTPHIMPSESTRLSCKRLYLEEAKRALAEEGGTYQPSQAELKAAAFDESIPYISKLVFSIGGFCTGHETTTIRLDEKHLYKTVEGFPILTPSNFHIPPDYPRGKEDFLRGLAKLHIGEWRSRYTLKRFGYYVCDGIQWELDIFFSNDHKPVHIYGDNAYPYNFREFQELMGPPEDLECLRKLEIKYLKQYDRVQLKNGLYASIVEIFEKEKAFLADIDKDGDTYTEDITADDIQRVLKFHEDT